MEDFFALLVIGLIVLFGMRSAAKANKRVEELRKEFDAFKKQMLDVVSSAAGRDATGARGEQPTAQDGTEYGTAYQPTAAMAGHSAAAVSNYAASSDNRGDDGSAENFNIWYENSSGSIAGGKRSEQENGQNSGAQSSAQSSGEKSSEHDQKWQIGLERQFGARLSVWMGGIALALAGFFMVKYSIDTGLLSPGVRIVMGLIFGLVLLYCANWVRDRKTFANGERIAQALTGAGIADLYGCVFAASSIYGFVPDVLGFSGMAAVTVAAVVLSLRHGMPIALLGLVGGLLTPSLFGVREANMPLLLIYLYFVFAGFMMVIRKRNWWAVSIPTMLGAFLWVCVLWFGNDFDVGQSVYLSLFLIAVSATVVFASNRKYDEESSAVSGSFRFASLLNYLTLGVAVLLVGLIAARAGFGLGQWGLFGLISLAGIALAFFNQRLYGLVPWLSMAVNAVMLLSWHSYDNKLLALMISIFGAMYIAAGYILQSRSERPLVWAGLAAAASIGYYLLGYYELHNLSAVAAIPMFWGLLALAFAFNGTVFLKKIIDDVPRDHPQKQHLTAIYAATSTAFLSIALTIELPRDFLSVAFAVQMCAIAWINGKVEVRALRYIAGILAGVFAFMLMPQIILLVQLTLYSVFEIGSSIQKSVPIVDWPVFQLGIPAVFFIIGSCLLRRQKDDKLVKALEVASIALIGVMAYYIMRHAFNVDNNVMFAKATFIERGTMTNALFAYSLACFWLGRKYMRPAVSTSGLVLFAVAVFRVCYFDILLYNPLWSAAQSVGNWPILNALLVNYALPTLWIWRAGKEISHVGKSQWNRYNYGLILLLAFVFLSLNIRQIFHGSYLHDHQTTNAEIYVYSAVWLLFGIVLLFIGTIRNDRMVRIASLLVLILTMGKAFLYDASELEGLLRVFSFFGLGLSLLGLSWFYTRFVFSNNDLLKRKQ